MNTGFIFEHRIHRRVAPPREMRPCENISVILAVDAGHAHIRLVKYSAVSAFLRLFVFVSVQARRRSVTMRNGSITGSTPVAQSMRDLYVPSAAFCGSRRKKAQMNTKKTYAPIFFKFCFANFKIAMFIFISGVGAV